MSTWAKVIWGIIIFILGAALSYWAGKKCFTNKSYEKSMERVEQHINMTANFEKET